MLNPLSVSEAGLGASGTESSSTAFPDPTGRLLESLLHDARNPLNALSIHLDVLTEKLRGADQVVPPGPDKNLRAMREQILRIDQVLKSFVEFLSPRAGGPSLLSDRVVQAVGLLKYELHRARLSVRLTVDPGLRTGEGKPAAINQLVVLGLMRAISRCAPGEEISVTLTGEGRLAVLRITDPGPPSRDPTEVDRSILELTVQQGGQGRSRGGDCVICLPLH